MDKQPQTILITGASSGIGQALALHYAGLPHHPTLLLTGRNEERLSDVAEACRIKGSEVHGGVLDVTKRKAMMDWISQHDDQSPIDLVIANAGISGGTAGHTEAEPITQVRQIFDINVTGVFNTIEPVLERMIERRHGQIAIMSSLAAYSGWAGAPAYSASKGAVRLYGEALRGSVAKYGIKVNVICPGFIKTPMTDVNSFSMPLLMSAADAAEKVVIGLDKNKGRICFPWPTYLFAGFLGLLPYTVSEFMFRLFPEKPSV